MKSVASFLLAFYYLVLSFGMSISQHFCADELVKSQIFSTEQHSCCCGTPTPSNCCENEVQTSQTDSAQSLISFDFHFQNPFAFLPNLIQIVLIWIHAQTLISHSQTFLAKKISIPIIPLFISHQNFRI